MSNEFDVIVVGAGPAGSVAALTCARGGASTLLLEKAVLPRDKACGDALIPDAIEILHELDLWERVSARGHAPSACRIYAPGGEWVDLEGRFCTLPRGTLDEQLARAAVAAGAELRDGTPVTGWEPRDDGARVTVVRAGREQRLRCRLVILAAGAPAGGGECFGLLKRRAPSAMAQRAYYRLPDGADETRLRIWYERPLLPGYGWVFPLGDGRFNVGVGTTLGVGGRAANLRTLWELFLARCPDAGALLAEGERLTPFRGAPLRTGLVGARPSADRLLACGEVIGTTYAFSGEGIGKAMHTGRLAAEVGLSALATGALDAASLRRYDALLEADLRRRFRQYDVAQRWVRRPWVCDLLVRRARNSTRVRGMLEDVIAERRYASEVLSLRGLVRMLLEA